MSDLDASLSESIIALGYVSGNHGFPKEYYKYKVSLFSRGLPFEPSERAFFVSQDKGLSYEPLKLVEDLAPLGAKWGEAQGVVLSTSQELSKGAYWGCKRSLFPLLKNDSEYYICDLIGAYLLGSESQKREAQVEGVYWQGPAQAESFNLEVKISSTQKKILVPWSDDLKFDFEKKEIVLPFWERWSEFS